MQSQGFKNQAGYTLVELAVSVTVAGVITTGVVAIGAYVWSGQRVEDLGHRMSMLVENVDQMFSMNTDYKSLNLETAVKLGLLRHESVEVKGSKGLGMPAASTAQHIYNQSITLGGLGHGSFNKLAWGLHYSRLPVNECMAIVHYALILADAVAIVPDPTGGPAATTFSDWGVGASPIELDAGKVIKFPAGYRVLKNEKSAKSAVKDRATECIAVSGASDAFGLAMVRMRL